MKAQINGIVKQLNYYIPKTMAKIVVLLVSSIIICSSFQVSKAQIREQMLVPGLYVYTLKFGFHRAAYKRKTKT